MSVATREQEVVERVPKQLWIGGEWRDASGGDKLPVEDPSTGETLTEVADGTAEDAKAALTAAHEAREEWAASAPNDRSQILQKAFETLNERAEDLALLMTLEMGKTITESKGEIAYAAEFFRWFAGEALRLDGYYKAAGNGSGRVLVMRQPVGPCLMITPWNFPTAMGTRKIGPAVAAGCTMVVKPASETPLSMLALARVLEDCGLPPGVLNVLTTSSSGAVMEPLIRDPRSRKLSFTGSTAVGRALVEQSAEQLLRVSMELGGNAPFLVFGDADLDAAVEGAITAKMRNIGEACTAANRFLVHESVADAFSRRLADRLGSMRMGRGTEEGVQVGPLITEMARAGVAELVADAADRGGTVLVGGEVPRGPGWFYPPTVLADVPRDARVFHEEIFGPVAPVTTFGTDGEALALANGTEFGLIAYAYTTDLRRALTVAEGLESGLVGLNAGVISNPAAPFGGVKASGFGREGGREGIEEY